MNRPLSIATTVLLATVAMLSTSCLPQQRFWWSPDGSRAAVVVGGALHLVDAEGIKVAEVSLAESQSVVSVEWASDGERLLLHSHQSVANWSEVAKLVPAGEIARVEALAAEMPTLIRAAVTLGGGVGSIEELFPSLNTSEPDLLGNALHLRLEQDPASLLPLLAETAGEPLDLEDVQPGAETSFLVYRFDVIAAEEASLPDQPALASLELLAQGRLSPSGKRLLYGRRHGKGAMVDLAVLDLQTGKAEVIAKRLFPAYEWESEQSLVTFAPVAQGETLLKQIRRYTVTSGEKPKATSLATSLIPFLPKIEVLPDQSLLFSCQASHLPALSTGSLPQSAFYRWVPESETLVRVPTSEGALPMNLGHFAVSPDGASVAVVESDTDAVAVVEIASGKVNLASPPHPKRKCRTLPAWRNPTELSFARYDPARDRVDWVLWDISTGKTEALNGDWPDAATADWIEEQAKGAE